MKPLKPQDLLVAALPTTVDKVLYIDVCWSGSAYLVRITVRTLAGVNEVSEAVTLAAAPRYSFTKLQTHAANCLMRDDVRQAVHHLCSEQGLVLMNPVF